MTHLENVFELANLRRAYRWIMSNPDRQYKSYFRDSYDAFAIASDTHLKWIRKEGINEKYQASHASKILVPKQSGILRPITLLSVEDQVVYQACVNVIAEALRKKTRNRYEKKVFAHLYAGKSSPFFYMQWQNSYKKFADKIKAGYSAGYDRIADFDLTSFYDSIDHHVLTHFLMELSIDGDTIAFLMDCLRHWTSTTWSLGPTNIYHGHGIPQGPLSSGMLSEAVLFHLDEAGEQGSKTIYLRYVDDIKILAKTEDELRRKLIKLDITSKEIGLFPQSSKINIHQIINPDEEVKSVSRPPEPSIKPPVDQVELVARIMQLTKGATVTAGNATRFKFLVAHAEPTYRLNQRLMMVLRKHPDLATSVCLYLDKYPIIPIKLAEAIADFICDGPELYHSVNGALLNATIGKVSGQPRDRIAKFCADRVVRPKRGFIPPQPTYREALIAWALSARTLTYPEYEKLMFAEADWWVQKRLLRMLDQSTFGKATYTELINRLLRVKGGEVSRVAASRLLQEKLALSRPYGDVDDTAKQILKAGGIIRSAGQPASRINEILSYILKRPQNTYEWKTLFGALHGQAELHSIFLKKNFESNIDAFLVQLDSYCDLMAEKAWTILKPGKNYPNYGHAIKDPTLTTALPDVMAAFLKLHDLRLQSATAHPRGKKTGSPTRRLKHRDFYKVRPDLCKAWDEFEHTITP